MEYRHSSPSTRQRSPRTTLQREKSNSLPYGSDVLGCSTPEAELILREGRAAVRNRRRGRRNPDQDNIYRPKDHFRFLQTIPTPSENPILEQSTISSSHHCRIPSDTTDRTTSTIRAPVESPGSPSHSKPTINAAGYSAGLAKFIQDQLSLIPTYQPTPPTPSVRSCPDLSPTYRSPPASPARATYRPVTAPKVINIPPVRPPLTSQFSAWSSTDDEDEEVPSSTPAMRRLTLPMPGFFEDPHETSFFLPSTPFETDDEDDPETARAPHFPDRPVLLESPDEPTSTQQDELTSSSSSQAHPSASSEPSASSASSASLSTDSYFDYKRPTSLSSGIRDCIQKVVTPIYNSGHVIHATSPFEGAALAGVHDVFVQSQKRVFVDGMSFDMLRSFLLPTRI